MVLSILNPNVNYFENNTVDNDDIDYDTSVYEGYLYDNIIEFVIGKPKFNYVDESDIIYFYIYLVKNDNVVQKIGVLECNKNDYKHGNLIDYDSGDLNLEKLVSTNDPLLFSFAKFYIKNTYSKISKILDDIDDDSDSDSDNDSDNNDDNMSDDDNESEHYDSDDNMSMDLDDTLEKEMSQSIKIVKEETKDDWINEKTTFNKTLDSKWINLFMKSNKYDIIEVDGDGNCFFHALKQALQSSDKYKSIEVDNIKERLAEEVDELLLQRFQEFYSLSFGGMKQSNNLISN